MRFILTIMLLTATPLFLGVGLMAQSQGQEALKSAKQAAEKAKQRSETMRQEAANSSNTADRLLAQRAVLSAEMDTANAQISAARARIAIIRDRLAVQQSRLGRQSAPVLRLNGALYRLTSRPTALLFAQRGSRNDYIRLRAVMSSVAPVIEQRTAALRQQIILQRELRGQQQVAVRSLGDARKELASRRDAISQLEKQNRNRAGTLSASAAYEFEQAIAQGEAARSIIENIDTARESNENATLLAALSGPIMRPEKATAARNNGAYKLPENAQLVFGVSELNKTGYRERGVRLLLPQGQAVTSPAAGKVGFAGIYRGYGNILIIEHGGGWITLVANLGDVSVDEGATVAQGDPIGSALSEKAEVTFELRRNGRIMDIGALLQ